MYKEMFSKQEPSVALIGTYPPNECGIATFTYDLVQAIEKQKVPTCVFAMEDDQPGYYPDPRVVFQIRRNVSDDYREAADRLNGSSTQMVSLQHEFGIFGGDYGREVLTLLRSLKVPVSTTLHTVLPKPTPEMRAVLREIVSLSTSVVVMARTAVCLLDEVYHVPTNHVKVIPHGTLPAPAFTRQQAKELFGMGDRMVLSTFGLLSRGKGIESVIRALPAVVEQFPEVIYLVLGQTHPRVRAEEGESYREFLQSEVERLGLQDHVRFVNQYLSLPTLLCYLRMTDVYLTPYLNPDQITSGTLTYALSAGCAVVSTPYLYATELLADGGGFLAGFDDPDAFAQCLLCLLSNPETLRFHQRVALRKGHAMHWDEVGKHYAKLFASTPPTLPGVKPDKRAAASSLILTREAMR